MADVTINNLTGQAPSLTDVFPFSTTGVGPATYKASLTQIKSALAISWTDVSGKPSFATVATTGSYNDLTNKPTIPAAVNSVQLARAWVRFNATGSNTSLIAGANYNVSGVSRLGAGQYRVTWSTPFANTNYCVIANGSGGQQAYQPMPCAAVSYTTTYVDIYTAMYGTNFTDNTFVTVVAFSL